MTLLTWDLNQTDSAWSGDALGEFVLGLGDCDEEKKQERPLGSIPRGHNRQAFTEVATPIADWPIAP